jgi:hypothetical protein
MLKVKFWEKHQGQTSHEQNYTKSDAKGIG